MRRLRPLLLALAACLATAAPAGAAPVNLGAGSTPSVAMDAAGTAYVSWQTTSTIGFCRLPRHANACDVRVDLPYEYEPLGGHTVRLLRRADGVLLIVTSTSRGDAAGSGATLVWTSGDGGASWSGPARIAGGSYGFDAVALSADGFSLVTLAEHISDLTFQQAPLAGGETRALVLADGGVQDPDIAVLPDGRMLATWYRTGEGTNWRIFGGGDPFDTNAWGTMNTVSRSDPGRRKLATGRRGTFLLEQRPPGVLNLPPYPPSWSIRAFDSRRNRWRAPRNAAGDRFMYGTPDMAQDGAGRLHIASANDGGSTGWTCVVYTRTGKKSSQWFGPTTVLFKTRIPQRKPYGAKLGVAPNGQGVAVWSDEEGLVWATPLRQKRGKARNLGYFHKRNCT